MAKLTEDMVTARARGADITTLRKLNCWGASLTDISLLRRMTNLEVIAFSVNQISSLADLSGCCRLQELYLRGNKIAELNELCYLQPLPALRSLLLKDNPIERLPLYRETVLRALPWLHKLDDLAVEEGEVENARRVGRELLHPLHSLSDTPPASTRSSSPQEEEEEEEDCYEEEYPDDCPSPGVENTPREARTEVYQREARTEVYLPEHDTPSQDPHVEDSPPPAPEPTWTTSRSFSAPRSQRLSCVRSSNVLSSVLLLIKELDVKELEVVQVSVESRIRDLCDD